MSWKRGPLPPDTWWWGGVVPKDHERGGFYFADFLGDHVMLIDGKNTIVQAADVKWYNNSLTLPPDDPHRHLDPPDQERSTGSKQ